MSDTHDPGAAANDPRLMEQMYRSVEGSAGAASFAADIERLYAAEPENALLAAWHYRLQQAQPAAAVPAVQARRINWQLAVPLGVILGLVYWLLLEREWQATTGMPSVFEWWAPLAAVAIIVLVTFGSAGKRQPGVSNVVSLGLLALAAYAVWMGGTARDDYRLLSIIHLPLAALIAVGLVAAGRRSDDGNRFAFLIKSTEAVVTGGIYAGATGLFVAVTEGIFAAIGVRFPAALDRLLVMLAAGLVPLLAVATVFDARFDPIDQRFEEGLGKLIFTLGRFFLPLTLLVGIVYVISIPFNFWRPFEQREVLIIYNVMLFAIMALLVFATPVTTVGISPAMQTWLRRGIVAVAFLAVLVSLYALSATVYRTAQGGLTINRLTIIGWNAINIGILLDLLYRQWRSSAGGWPAAIWRTCRAGMIGYTVWTLFLLLAIPWLFPA